MWTRAGEGLMVRGRHGWTPRSVEEEAGKRARDGGRGKGRGSVSVSVRAAVTGPGQSGSALFVRLRVSVCRGGRRP